LPNFRFDKASNLARHAKVFLRNSKSSNSLDAAQGAEQQVERAGNRERFQRSQAEYEQRLRSQIDSRRPELIRLRTELRVPKVRRKEREKILSDRTTMEYIELKTKRKRLQQEVFELQRQLQAAKEQRAEGEAVTGALPDFVLIGVDKAGTTSFYDLLTQHPLVERAAVKELHFFNDLFGEGVEWYRRCFPTPRWKDGRRTITGEATPIYLSHPHAAKRMSQTIPQARFIVLLRNPVDRAYSHYQMLVRRGYEPLTFEKAIEAEEARSRGERDKLPEDEHYTVFNLGRFSYLSRSLYVDQLVRWFEFIGNEQTLVLKSEDYFESPQETMRLVLDFIDLPDWEPETWEVRSKYGKVKQQMNPSTRRRLEEYFEPHNRRLYELLGKDFGW
jgi:Sulfotransferase domain